MQPNPNYSGSGGGTPPPPPPVHTCTPGNWHWNATQHWRICSQAGCTRQTFNHGAHDWNALGRCRQAGCEVGHIGWLNVGGQWYYFDSASNRRTGWHYMNGWRYFDSTFGVLFNRVGWERPTGHSDEWHFMERDEHGRAFARTGWRNDNGWRFLDPSNHGRMAYGTYPSLCRFE